MNTFTLTGKIGTKPLDEFTQENNKLAKFNLKVQRTNSYYDSQKLVTKKVNDWYNNIEAYDENAEAIIQAGKYALVSIAGHFEKEHCSETETGLVMIVDSLEILSKTRKKYTSTRTAQQSASTELSPIASGEEDVDSQYEVVQDATAQQSASTEFSPIAGGEEDVDSQYEVVQDAKDLLNSDFIELEY